MSDLLKVRVGGSRYLCKFKPPFKQGWTEDESVTTSLEHKIPVDDCSIDVSLISLTEKAGMQQPVDDCSIDVSLLSLTEKAEMQQPVDECSIGVSLISLTELTN